MHMQWMKRIDRFAGYPLCGALKALDLASGDEARVDESRARVLAPGAAARPPEIGFIKFWGMGSLILASPAFHAVKQARPDARVHLVTLEQNRRIVELLGIADTVHTLSLPPSPAGVAAGIAGMFRRLGSIGLDAVIDLEYLSRFSAICAYLTRAPVRVGYHSWDVWRGDLHNVRRAFNPYWHVTENFLNLAAALGADPERAPGLTVRAGEEAEEGAARLLTEAGVSEGERLIAVNANASTMALARRWPEEHFLALIDRIVETGLGRPALLGSPEEAPYIEDLARRVASPDEIVNLAGRSTLTDLVGVLKRSALLVTNDSGPLHLAGALGTPTVSFFGPETPTLFGPRGSGHQVLYRGIDCSPCINIYNAKTVRCVRGEPECLSGIGVDEAFEAVRRSGEDAA